MARERSFHFTIITIRTRIMQRTFYWDRVPEPLIAAARLWWVARRTLRESVLSRMPINRIILRTLLTLCGTKRIRSSRCTWTVLAFLGEYGLIFTVAFFILYYRLYRKTAKAYYLIKNEPDARIIFRYSKFLIILLPLLLLIDNYLEYPEVMLLIVLSIKLAQIDLLTKHQTLSADAT